MKLESIRFSTNDTHLGAFHKITICASYRDEEDRYRQIDYWCIAGYSLINLIQNLIEKLNQLFGNDDFPDLEVKE